MSTPRKLTANNLLTKWNLHRWRSSVFFRSSQRRLLPSSSSYCSIIQPLGYCYLYFANLKGSLVNSITPGAPEALIAASAGMCKQNFTRLQIEQLKFKMQHSSVGSRSDAAGDRRRKQSVAPLSPWRCASDVLITYAAADPSTLR